jgi:hypothetical protein
MRTDIILKTLAWRELALLYLYGWETDLQYTPTIVNAVVDFDCTLIPAGRPLRHHAHDFVAIAVAYLENGIEHRQRSTIWEWLHEWATHNVKDNDWYEWDTP